MYAVATEVPAPAELYDAIHAELLRRTEGAVEGLLVHIGRATKRGFEVIEVWESREQFERYTEFVNTVVAELSQGDFPLAAPAVEEFDLRGLLIPAAKISR
ncbi:hypothetical protein [Couchioplanes azureus]|uniref:hypothetical protein n=1 Tax=Couchioplanes caeruleus TaxID=56438 RepID=UPI00166FA3B9|nr:hypothetical protein [Couchioplanes caeruleus]GGQ56337.1 hypothetical protein GCM10010166_27260 [Couchioplanes caeruleus subsp. azureus]